MLTTATLRDLGLFKAATTPALDVLARHAAERRFATGQTIFRAGTRPAGWYVVLEGGVRVVRGSGSRQHVVHTETRGGTLGEVPLFAGEVYPATAIASEPTWCAVIPLASLREAIAVDPTVAFLLLERLSRRVQVLVDRLDQRSAHSVRARLLDWIARRSHAAHGSTFSLGMTQGDLAEELGTVREVVSRELRALVSAGTIAAAGRGRYRLTSRAV
jgi:CRP/FNR family transcriptional regulator